MNDTDDSATKPDFTAATHGIMGVLHQVMQVRLTRPVLITDWQTDRWTDCRFRLCRRVIMRWRGRGSIVNFASTSVCSCVCSNKMFDRYDSCHDFYLFKSTSP